MKTKASITALCAILLCSVLLFGCSPKNTPTRIGETVAQGSIDFPYTTLEDYLEDVDILAEVEITEWLGESNSVWPTTFYKAEILKEYVNITGKKIKVINIVQSGNSEKTFSDYPLFGVGDKLLLGLNDANKMLDKFDTKEQANIYKDHFYIEGSIMGAMQIRQTGGKEFAVSYIPTPLLELNELKIKSSDKNYSSIQKIGKELTQELNFSAKTELQKQGGYRNITERTVIEADKLREYIESLR